MERQTDQGYNWDMSYNIYFEQPVTDGVEFEIIEQRNTWLHIRLPDGRDGWIPVNGTEVI